MRGTGLVDAADCGGQLSLLPEDAHRDKWEVIDQTVDLLRQRYGYMSVRRALMDTDKQLGSIDPKDDHTVHPVGFFGG